MRRFLLTATLSVATLPAATLLLSGAPAGAAELQVVAEPGVDLWLNGRHRGTTTAAEGGRLFTGLPAGTFALKIMRSGQRAQVFSGRLRGDETRIIELAAAPVRAREAGLLVESAPVSPPAEVWLDGERRGLTPLTLDALSAGRHHLEVRRGGQVAAHDVQLVRGRVAHVTGQFGQARIVDEGGGEVLLGAHEGVAIPGEVLAEGWRVRYDTLPGAPRGARVQLDFDPERRLITVQVGGRAKPVIDDLK